MNKLILGLLCGLSILIARTDILTEDELKEITDCINMDWAGMTAEDIYPLLGNKGEDSKNPGQERGHVPSAVCGATTCPRSNRRAATGGCPYKGKRMGNPECDDVVPPFLQPCKGDREQPGV